MVSAFARACDLSGVLILNSKPEQIEESEEKPVASPCISVCVLDETDICTGCFRNVQEITDWSILSNENRREVVRVANARRKAYFNI